MKRIALALYLFTAPSLAAQHEEPTQPLPGLPDHPLAAVVLVIPASLYVLAEFWQRTCEASGNEFYQDESTGLWKCSGFPLPPSG